MNKTNEKLHETIKNVSFNENPDIFCIRKDAQTFFANITALEARQLLSNEEATQKVNIGWELVQ